jgi:hypothetical protein
MLAITSPTSGDRSVGIVRSRTQTMEFFFLFMRDTSSVSMSSQGHCRLVYKLQNVRIAEHVLFNYDWSWYLPVPSTASVPTASTPVHMSCAWGACESSMCCVHYFCLILTKIGTYRQISLTLPYMKFMKIHSTDLQLFQEYIYIYIYSWHNRSPTEFGWWKEEN